MSEKEQKDLDVEISEAEDFKSIPADAFYFSLSAGEGMGKITVFTDNLSYEAEGEQINQSGWEKIKQAGITGSLVRLKQLAFHLLKQIEQAEGQIRKMQNEEEEDFEPSKMFG